MKLLLRIFIPGTCKPKGSTRSFKHAKTGNVVTLGATKETKSWQARIEAIAAQQARDLSLVPSGDAIALRLCFVFARPASHFGTGKNSELLKPSAPLFPTSRSCGDIDKLERTVLDALTGIAYRDDSQVCRVLDKAKVYADPARQWHPGAWIEVLALEASYWANKPGWCAVSSCPRASAAHPPLLQGETEVTK